MAASRSDDERRSDLEAQCTDLRRRLAAIKTTDENAAGDAAKLSNAVTQAEHEITTLDHLKLQREKVKKPEASGPVNDEQLDERAAAWLRKRGKLTAV